MAESKTISGHLSGDDEVAAFNKVLETCKQSEYVVKSVTAQMIRDGYLKPVVDEDKKMREAADEFLTSLREQYGERAFDRLCEIAAEEGLKEVAV
ncbi:hypothetical protein MLD52_21715 [Puniceicoccaceae bacterium K14]|nr:hypothetical protein [Puniceicoccaceae bacterium K14]